jgi:hypothetical protein
LRYALCLLIQFIREGIEIITDLSVLDFMEPFLQNHSFTVPHVDSKHRYKFIHSILPSTHASFSFQCLGVKLSNFMWQRSQVPQHSTPQYPNGLRSSSVSSSYRTSSSLA